MQMGRRIEAFHKAILHFMSANEIPACDENYIYEKQRGQIINPKFEELSENISKTKFLSVPQDLSRKRLLPVNVLTLPRVFMK